MSTATTRNSDDSMTTAAASGRSEPTANAPEPMRLWTSRP